ncbi:MAG: hypothetical protein ACXAC6_11000 [Candidatus Hodarchaeales archaeon]
MIISDKQDYKIVYRRWVLFVPILIIVFGIILVVLDGTSYTSIGLIGSLSIIIGILTLGVLLVGIFTVWFSARTLTKTARSQTSFREKIEAVENSIQEKMVDNS